MNILLDLFSPLQLALTDKDELAALVKKLGWEVEFNDTQTQALQAILDISEQTTAIAGAVQSIAQNGMNGEAVESLILAAEGIFDKITTLSSLPQSQFAQLPDPFRTGPDRAEFALRLPEYLIVQWLDTFQEPVAETLRLIGLISEDKTHTPPLVQINWEGFGTLVTDPVSLIRETYDWGGDFAHQDLMVRLINLAIAFGIQPRFGPVHPDLIDGWGPVSNGANALQIVAPILRWSSRDNAFSFMTDLVFAPAAENGAVAGLQLTNITEGAFSDGIDLGNGWRFETDVSGDLNGALALKLLPSGIRFDTSLTGADAAAELRLIGAPETPYILIGKEDGPRLELAQFSTHIATDISTAAQELRFGATTRGSEPGGLRLVIEPGEGDGFIADILGDTPLIIEADIGVAWSSETGFQFEGGVGFDVDLLLDLGLGPIRIDTLHLSLYGGTEGATFEAAVTGGLNIGVAACAIEEIGIRGKLEPTPEGENSPLGPLKPSIGFKPPKGIGLVINAADVVTGGGYLYHDEALAEYGGVAELGFVSLKLSAIGILTTRMPDGSDGWSLFLSIFAEFPPLNIGFGFTLNGVGGLVGLHRTFDDEALRARLLDGALDSIMFPENPVANAPRILNDIRAVFPPCQGQFVFGAMMKLGWGTPTVLTLDLGVIVEVPDPIKIALLGQLNMSLPKPEKVIIELNMDVFGVVNITEGTFAMDATIRDSHILQLLTLSGDMAFRASFGDQPQMLMSIGGFHPKFTPPDNVPSLRRMKASLPLGQFASVELSAYIAITSNTFQVGGRLDIWVRVAGFTAEGWFGFDALIQFSPFGFDFLVTFGVSVRAGRVTLMGVDVVATIVGPGPWEIDGVATFEILKIKKSISIDLEVGQAKQVSVPSYDVAALLRDALEDPGAWGTSEAAAGTGVILSETGEDRVHPGGVVTVSQKLVPFGEKLDKFGNGTVDGAKKFTLISAAFDGSSSSDTDILQDWFASAEFFNMKDLEKIKAPSFEAYDAGVAIGSGAFEIGGAADREVAFEEIEIDPQRNLRRKKVKKSETAKIDLIAKAPNPKAQGADKPQFALKTQPIARKLVA